jgi:hypothetical protein
MNKLIFFSEEFRKYNPTKSEMKTFQIYLKEVGIEYISDLSKSEIKDLIEDFFDMIDEDKIEIFIEKFPIIKSPKYKDELGLIGNMSIFMAYLLKKHKNVCTKIIKYPQTYGILSFLVDQIRIENKIGIVILMVVYDMFGNFIDEPKVLSPNEFKLFLEKIILSCDTYKFLAIPIGFSTTEASHQNILLINFENKMYEIYDPHGKPTSKYTKNRKFFENVLKDVLSTYTYIDIKTLCPEYSFQSMENLQESKYLEKLEKKYGREFGFCKAWSAFYLDLRLTYPDIDPYMLQISAINEIGKGDFTEFIVSYIDFISKQYPEYYKTLF